MKVTKNMIHEDLQKSSNLLQLVPGFLTRKWSVNCANFFIDKIYKGKNIDSLDCSEVYINSKSDNYKIRVKVYKPKKYPGKLPILLYIHGGGYIIGNPEQFGNIIEKYIETRPCIVVSPDYRLALEKPYPAALNDCYDTLLWAKENADKIDGDSEKIMVAGHSAGGGLTAAVTLKNRDTKAVKIAFQMPIYPMIDDTQYSDSDRHIITPAWDSRSNKFAWESYLSDIHKNGSEIPSYSAPARNKDYSDFPPTITFVGNLDPFYKETLAYVDDLKSTNIDVTFKEYDRCFHGFDMMAGESDISNDALNFTFENFGKYYDKYL
ncbi:MAG: alpha/beta hydrolase [Firmicutes bacterium]|jgi:acetyl esterase/lipase|nr:alpha/beta hydrolase [Bacillota bacterium]